jgi:hypothetical protein
MNAPLNILAALASYRAKAVIENGRVRLVCLKDNPPPAELIEAARAHKGELHQLLVTQEARCDRFEERTAILEFDEGLSRAEAEAIARREMLAGVYDVMQAARDPGSYASALAALRANRPAYVDAADWQQAIEDGHRFVSKWGKQAEALCWGTGRPVRLAHTAREAGAQIPTTIPLRPDGLDLAVARPARDRADADGSDHSCAQRCEPDVPQVHQAGAGTNRRQYRWRRSGAMSRPVIMVGCWPRRMSAELAAAYCGEGSVKDFLKRVGSEYPEARVKQGRRKLWLRDDLDQAILPAGLAAPRDLAEDL